MEVVGTKRVRKVTRPKQRKGVVYTNKLEELTHSPRKEMYSAYDWKLNGYQYFCTFLYSLSTHLFPTLHLPLSASHPLREHLSRFLPFSFLADCHDLSVFHAPSLHKRSSFFRRTRREPTGRTTLLLPACHWYVLNARKDRLGHSQSTKEKAPTKGPGAQLGD